MTQPDVVDALQTAVAKSDATVMLADKAIKLSARGGSRLVLRAKKRIKPVKFGLSKKLPSALRLGMRPTSAYGKARLEANVAGRKLVPRGMRMQREGKAMQQEASDLVRRQQRNAYGHLTEPQRNQVFRDIGEQRYRAQEPGLFLEVNGEHLASNGLKAGRAAKKRGKALL